MPAVVHSPLSLTNTEGSEHWSEFIDGYAPFARVVVLDWIPAVEHQDAVSFTSRFLDVLAVDGLEQRSQLSAVKFSGFSIFFDAMQTDSDDHRGKPMVKCILLLCSEFVVERGKAGRLDSQIAPLVSSDGGAARPAVTHHR